MAKQRPTVRTISSNEAKQRWGSLMSAVVDDGDEVVIESHGKPKVAVISYEEFQQFVDLREKRRREEALRRFDALTERLSQRNQDLAPEQVDRLAVRAGREINAELAAKQRQRADRNTPQ
jgi:prevent-host-death family protein